MANLDNFRGDGEQSIPNNITTWTESASGSSGTATATHAAEANKTHYITGLACSAQAASGSDPDMMICVIKDGTDIIITFTFQSSVIDDDAPGGDGPVVHSFAIPIQITEGNLTSIALTGGAGGDKAYANLWGFTNYTRIE